MGGTGLAVPPQGRDTAALNLALSWRATLLFRQFIRVTVSLLAGVGRHSGPNPRPPSTICGGDRCSAARAGALPGSPVSRMSDAGFDNGGLWRSTIYSLDVGAPLRPAAHRLHRRHRGVPHPKIIYADQAPASSGPTSPPVMVSCHSPPTPGRTGPTSASCRTRSRIAHIRGRPHKARIVCSSPRWDTPTATTPAAGGFSAPPTRGPGGEGPHVDEYTSGNDVAFDPSNPQTVYATLWRQQQSFREDDRWAGGGIFKSTHVHHVDPDHRWTPRRARSQLLSAFRPLAGSTPWSRACRQLEPR